MIVDGLGFKAQGRRYLSLITSAASGVLPVGLLTDTWGTMKLDTFVWTMVAASVAQVAGLLWAFVR